jgi:hypothetical protein
MSIRDVRSLALAQRHRHVEVVGYNPHTSASRAAVGKDRERLWKLWRDQNLDDFAARRP